MPLDLLRSLNITSDGFGTEAEITGKLLARRIRPLEVPITYRARGREEVRKSPGETECRQCGSWPESD